MKNKKEIKINEQVTSEQSINEQVDSEQVININKQSTRNRRDRAKLDCFGINYGIIANSAADIL